MNDRRRAEYNFRGKVRNTSATETWALNMIGSGIVLGVVFLVSWGVTAWVIS